MPTLTSNQSTVLYLSAQQSVTLTPSPGSRGTVQGTGPLGAINVESRTFNTALTLGPLDADSRLVVACIVGAVDYTAPTQAGGGGGSGDVTLDGAQTLTNKTLTAPVINSPTGITAADVGLGGVVADLATKATTVQFDDLVTDVNVAIASKENVLTFGGLASRIGNAITVNPAQVSGLLFDGATGYCLPGQASFVQTGAQHIPIAIVHTTYGQAGPNNPTTNFGSRGRARLTGVTGAGNHARLVYGPRVRFPENSTSTLGGFRVIGTYGAADALTGTIVCFGVVQTAPTIGTEVDAYTGSKFAFGAKSGQTTIRVWNANTELQDLGANFPKDGNGTAVYQWEIWSKPFPNFGVQWRLINLHNGADTGYQTFVGGPLGGFDPTMLLVRDSGANTTSAILDTTGIVLGGFCAFTTGTDIGVPSPIPRELTGATTFVATDLGGTTRFNSASTAVLTIPSDATLQLVPGAATINVLIKGVGVPTIAFTGGAALATGSTVPSGLAQGSSIVLHHTGDANTWAYA